MSFQKVQLSFDLEILKLLQCRMEFQCHDAVVAGAQLYTFPGCCSFGGGRLRQKGGAESQGSTLCISGAATSATPTVDGGHGNSLASMLAHTAIPIRRTSFSQHKSILIHMYKP